MPVKNVKRKTNDGFEGVITGLNDKEKEIIANSVGIEANPSTEATETLMKLKVGNTTYNFNETLEKNGIYSGVDGNTIFNGISVSAEEFEKIKNGVVLYVYGTYKSAEDQEATPYFASYAGKAYDGETTSYVFHYVDTTIDYGVLSVESINLVFQEYQGETGGAIVINKSRAPSTPSRPSDAIAKTYTLRSVNGTLTWVDTSVGTQYFEDINVGGVSLDDKINSAINSAITSTLEANY